MGTLIITFRSVTPAQRAEKLLRGTGIQCDLGRTPRWMEEQGCGYNVRVRWGKSEDISMLLRSHKIPFRKVYLQHSSGETEELQL